MLSSAQVGVVIPCLNEAEAIGSLVESIRRVVPAVIVIDDGSGDDTSGVAKRAGAGVIRHSQSMGKGRALETGIEWAREGGFQWVLTMDGDGQHSPGDMEKFLRVAPEVGLVVGNRMGEPGRMPFVRRQVNRWMSREISRLAGRELPDTQCGFRRIRLEAWQGAKARPEAAHFEIESEMILGFVAAGEAVEFVPIEVVYKNERSKIHPVRDTIRWFQWRREAARRYRRLSGAEATKPICATPG